MKNPATPNGLVHKKVMLTDANGKPDGRYVYVLAKPEPKVTPTNAMLAEIETLRQNRLAILSLGIKGFSPSQIQRMSDMVDEIEKKIEALSESVPTDHGPHADNGVGYERYVCETNPAGFCLNVQNHIAGLIHDIRTDSTRKGRMGFHSEGTDADTTCGVLHPSNLIDLDSVIKMAVCLDKDMWEYFVVDPVQGESKQLSKDRHELWCLTGITPLTSVYERGNRKGI